MIMKAKEAKELAISKSPSIDIILENIKANAEAGYWQYSIPFLLPETLTELLNLGYVVKVTDEYGYEISWK